MKEEVGGHLHFSMPHLFKGTMGMAVDCTSLSVMR